MTVIRNLSASGIELNDLGGIYIEAFSDYDLSEELHNDIANSQDLNAIIVSGDIVFIDAQGNQLTQQESLNIQNATSAISPSFTIYKQDTVVVGNPFSSMNFGENISVVNNTPTVDIDFMTNLGISTSIIGGQEMLAFNDSTRTNKLLSIEKAKFLFVQATVSAGTYLKIGNQNTSSTEGYIMPFDGTVVGISSHIVDPNGRTGTYDMHFDNDAGTPTLITYSGNNEQKMFDNTLDYDILAGQTLQFRCDSISGGGMNKNQYDINVVLYVRWRG